MKSIEINARQHERIYSINHRKLFGAHYTPDSVVDYIVNRTIRPYLDSPDFLLSIKILDPACGSGLFLLKAFDVLAGCWNRSFGKFTSEDAQHLIKNSLFGIDIDEQAVFAARRNLHQKALRNADSFNLDSNIVVGDALSLRHLSDQMQLGEPMARRKPLGEKFLPHSFNCIIGNPPYVRIQNTPLDKRKRYVSSYTTASGRFDVSALFVELSEYLLKENGRLGFIVSNKLLTTSGAKKLRSFLLTNFTIEEIVDLSDTKLFDAAILPLILIVTRSKQSAKHISFSKITESKRTTTEVEQTADLLQLLRDSEIPFEANVSNNQRVFQVQRFFVTSPSKQVNIWTFHNERENFLLSKLKDKSACTLSDICEKISVGLKTTADNIFIKPMTKSFINQHGFEENLIHPLLDSHNVDRWCCSWNSKTDLYVLYPHLERNGRVIPIKLDEYPHAKKYLEENRVQLEGRKYLVESQRQWYEIWVHQSPRDFRQRKIVTPDISSYNRFALDDHSLFVNGTCFYLILKDKSDISYYSILGLLNSKILEFFHKTTSGNSLYAKRFRYWTSYLSSYPIPQKILNSSPLVSLMVQNVSGLLSDLDDKERVEREKENDRICYQLFDLTACDVQEIEKILSIHKSQPVKKGISKK